ncbi:MAG: fluoride efflux transporter CrcB [Alphaproteobacteria bacterium]
MSWLLVALGGAGGAMARHGVGIMALRLMGPGFPWGTLAVNIFGSLLMGLLVGLLARVSGLPIELQRLLATGFLGAFTTFSTFALDAVTLYERGHVGLAAVYVLASAIGALAGCFLGLWIMKSTS